MVSSNHKMRRVDRRVSLQATNRLQDQLLTNEIVTSIADHQYTLFKNKFNTLKRVYALEKNEEKNRKILNDWIYIASTYCYILSENDFDCCDEFAVELFAAYYLICKLVFKKVKDSGDLSSVDTKDRSNINILLTKSNDLLSSTRHDYFHLVKSHISSLLSSTVNDDTELTTRSKSLDPKNMLNNHNDSNKTNMNSPADFYPQSNGTGDDDYADNEDDNSSTSSTTNSLESLSPDGNTFFPMNSINAESVYDLNPEHLLILNIQAKNIRSRNIKILTVSPNSIKDPYYFEASVLPYLRPKLTIVFFTRSEIITEIETSVYTQLRSHKFEKSYWLEGGFHAFKREASRHKLLEEVPPVGKSPLNHFQPLQSRQIAKQTSTVSSTPPPIPIAMPIITNSTIDSTIENPMRNTNNYNEPQQSPSFHYQNSNNTLYPNNNNTNGVLPNGSSSYSSLSDSKSTTSNESTVQYPLYNSTENAFKRLSMGAVEDSTNQNPLTQQIKSMKIPQQQIQTAPSYPLPPIPTAPPIQPIVTTTTIPSVPNTVSQKSVQPTLYQLSRLDYKPLVSLRNLGSTCYINSMIQCLFSLKKFRQFFINDDKLKKYITELVNKRNLRLTSGFHEMFLNFYDRSPHNALPPVIDITRFLSIIARLNPSYNIPNEQQDTSQFLYYIIDELHKELKMNYERANQLGLLELTPDEEKGEKYFNWQLRTLEHEGFSFIQNLFNIKEAVVMKCSRCGYQSTRYDTSIMMHLSLKRSASSLNDILKQNFVPEEMSARLGNAWDCDGCTKAEKELEELQEKIERENENLSNFKEREFQDKDKEKEKEKEKGKNKNKDKDKDKAKLSSKLFRRHKGKNHKESKESKETDNEATEIETTPDLPTEFLSNTLTEHEKNEYNRLADIFTRERIAYRSIEFVDLPDVLVLCLSLFDPSQKGAKVSAKHLKFPETLNMEFEKCSRSYKLNSWIDHLGSSIDSGHYTATVPFQKDKYIVCDDDKLLPAQRSFSGTVQDNNVYLLFYEAVN